MKNCISLIALLSIGITLGNPLWAMDGEPEQTYGQLVCRRAVPIEGDDGEKENPNRVSSESLPAEIQQEIFLHVLKDFIKRPIDEFKAILTLRLLSTQASWLVTHFLAIKARIQDTHLEKGDNTNGSPPQAFCLLYALTKGAELTATNHHEDAIKLYCKASEGESPIAESRLIGLRLAEYCDASVKMDPQAVRLPESLQNIPKKRKKTLCRNPIVQEKLQKTAASFYEEIKKYYESGTDNKEHDPRMNRAFLLIFNLLIKERQAHFPVVQACLIGKTIWVKKAAKLGHAEFQHRLSDLYSGINDLKAKQWLEKAAAQNHVEALYELAIMYRRGEGVEKDLQKAAELFEKAAVQGHAGSQDSLGNMYFAGEGVEKDRQKARELWEKARAQGVW